MAIPTSSPDPASQAKETPGLQPWAGRLTTRINLALLAVGGFCVSVFTLVMYTQGQTLVAKEADRLAIQSGHTLLARLEGTMARAEAITVAEARTLENHLGDEAAIRQSIPKLLSPKGYEDFIAGGGVWPEPKAFNVNSDRASFFWGRDEKGTLRFYDDYNRPEGPGYHEEEWYVPAKYSREDMCYWSKSYMDPYSYEPMTTCAVPAHREGKLIGVATLDIKLTGLREFLKEAARDVEGYAFALDRNNRFLSYPDLRKARLISKDAIGNPVQEYITSWAMAEKEPAFTPFHNVLDRINRKLVGKGGEGLAALARKLDMESYQIGLTEAQLIVAQLQTGKEPGQVASVFQEQIRIPSDPVLKKPAQAIVFLSQQGWWKLVLVVPESHLYQGTSTVLSWFYGVNLVFLLLAMLAVSLVVSGTFIRPLTRTIRALETLERMPVGEGEKLDEDVGHELGLLTAAFNRRSAQLREALKAVEEARAELETRVKQRTAELQKANEYLTIEVEERKLLEEERIKIQKELMEASRQAGMAEVATGVLHNVGNVLNSLNVSVSVLMDRFRKGKTEGLNKAAVLLRQTLDALPGGRPPEKGEQLVEYLEKVAAVIEQERRETLGEFDVLSQGLDHIKEIVGVQQSYAKVTGLIETVRLQDVIEYALSINDAGLIRHSVKVVKEFEDLPAMQIDKQRVLQILINLLSNAKYAMKDVIRDERLLILRLRVMDKTMAVVEVEDNGHGISEENLVRIFTHGFTTRPDGHGFGLHAAAIAASELGGSLSVKSKGIGKGALFVLQIPYKSAGLEVRIEPTLHE